jgi:hypothetical protein
MLMQAERYTRRCLPRVSRDYLTVDDEIALLT